MICASNRYEERLYYIEMNLTKKEFPKAIKINEENEYKLIYDTIIYGIRKFMKSIGINKVVIGVSGGIDSALSSTRQHYKWKGGGTDVGSYCFR